MREGGELYGAELLAHQLQHENERESGREEAELRVEEAERLVGADGGEVRGDPAAAEGAEGDGG